MNFTPIKKGDTGETVSRLNSMLSAIGYSIVNATDNFDVKTKAGVMAFQSDNNLPTTGTVDEGTWDLLKEQYKKALAQTIKIEEVEVNASINNISVPTETPSPEETLADIPEETVTEPPEETVETPPEETPDQDTQEIGIISEKPAVFRQETGDFEQGIEIELMDFPITLEVTEDQSIDVPLSVEPTMEETAAVAEESIDIALTDEQSFQPLSEGNTGDKVLELQRKLKAIGYYSGEPSSIFDAKTADAVVRFQFSRKLPAGGVVDMATWEALETAYADPERNTNSGSVCAKEQREAEDEPSADNFPTLSVGDSGIFVEVLERYLIDLNYLDRDISGEYDGALLSAVIRFKEDNGLPPDGNADRILWTALQQAGERKTAEKSQEQAAAPIRGEVDTYPILKRGDTGPYVKNLQSVLRRVTEYSGDTSGIFDGETESALKDFQASRGIPVTGTVDESTRRVLMQIFSPEIM